jgi:hypothetical protein
MVNIAKVRMNIIDYCYLSEPAVDTYRGKEKQVYVNTTAKLQWHPHTSDIIIGAAFTFTTVYFQGRERKAANNIVFARRSSWRSLMCPSRRGSWISERELLW